MPLNHTECKDRGHFNEEHWDQCQLLTRPMAIWPYDQEVWHLLSLILARIISNVNVYTNTGEQIFTNVCSQDFNHLKNNVLRLLSRNCINFINWQFTRWESWTSSRILTLFTRLVVWTGMTTRSAVWSADNMDTLLSEDLSDNNNNMDKVAGG